MKSHRIRLLFSLQESPQKKNFACGNREARSIEVHERHSPREACTLVQELGWWSSHLSSKVSKKCSNDLDCRSQTTSATNPGA